MRHPRLVAALAIGFVLASGSVLAQKQDFVREGAPVPPKPAASTNTVINYAGGVPAFFLGSFDAQDSTYNRCVTCAALSGVGTAVPYDTITINNVSGAVANIVVFSSTETGAACAGAPDTFFTLYDTTFNAGAPLTGCLAVNDDINGSSDRCSSLTFSIPAGATRVVVAATFDNATLPSALFTYRINFTGTTPVELTKYSVE